LFIYFIEVFEVFELFMGDGLNDIFDILLFFGNVSFFDIFTSLERLLKSISPGTINNCSIGSMHIFIFILVLKLSTFHKTVQFSEFIKIGDNEISNRKYLYMYSIKIYSLRVFSMLFHTISSCYKKPLGFPSICKIF